MRTKSKNKTKTGSKKYSAAQIEQFKLLRKAEAEYQAECKALCEQREWQVFLEWQERNKDRILKAPAAPPPVLVLDLPPIPALTPPLVGALPRAVSAPVLQAPVPLPAPVLRGRATPEELAARIELARQYRERCKEEVA